MANERPVKAMRTGRPLLRYHYVSRKTFDYFVEMVQYRYDQASSDTLAMGTVSTITLLRVIVDTLLLNMLLQQSTIQVMWCLINNKAKYSVKAIISRVISLDSVTIFLLPFFLDGFDFRNHLN